MYVYKKDKKYYWGDKEISKFDYHKFIFSICIEPPDGDQWKDIVKNYEGEKTLQQHYPIFYGCPPPGIGSDAFTLDDDGRELCVFLREDSVEYKYVDFNQSVQDICDLCCCFYKTVYLDTEEIDESQIYFHISLNIMKCTYVFALLLKVMNHIFAFAFFRTSSNAYVFSQFCLRNAFLFHVIAGVASVLSW